MAIQLPIHHHRRTRGTRHPYRHLGFLTLRQGNVHTKGTKDILLKGIFHHHLVLVNHSITTSTIITRTMILVVLPFYKAGMSIFYFLLLFGIHVN
ncbi:hypothetical protein Pint_02543 [Pistacia integerrima]|uniref:Uncharacterized protein n=1 Tax=Pistacia integerrima TaxID=434235 RepID=A0ACC0ZP37_9ROSI|nr:hypothetical protein Pint_02543 [Pistacia integerrima]